MFKKIKLWVIPGSVLVVYPTALVVLILFPFSLLYAYVQTKIRITIKGKSSSLTSNDTTSKLILLLGTVVAINCNVILSNSHVLRK
jgi:hypothetical protein